MSNSEDLRHLVERIKESLYHHLAGLHAIVEASNVPICPPSAQCKQYDIVYCLTVNYTQESGYE